MLETAGRPHRSVKSKESIFGTRAVEQSWKRPFNDPIPLPRGGPLITLEDAGNYITRLPKAVHEAAEWQAAMEALILVMTLDSPTMFARIGVMRALNGHVERVFNPDRKGSSLGESGNWRETDANRANRTFARATMPGHFYGPVLCPRILLFPDFCSGIFPRPDVYPCIMHAPDLCSDIMLGPHMFAGIFHGSDLCPCIFLGRPSLKLLQQGFGWRLTDFGLALIGRLNSAGNFVARLFLGRPSLELLQQGFGRWLTDFGLALIGSFKSGSNFVARRRFACCRQQSRGVGG